MKRIFLLLALVVLSAPSLAGAQTDLLLYNGDSSLVNQPLEVDLKPGANDITTANISKRAFPESIRIIPPSGAPSLIQYKTTFYDANCFRDEVFRLYRDRTIPMRIQEGETHKNADVRVLPQTFLSSHWGSRQWNFLVDGHVVTEEASGTGSSLMPVLPAEQTLQLLTPKLDFTLAATKAYKGPVTLSYLTYGLSWSGKYNLVVDPVANTADLIASSVVENNTDIDFPDARVKLVPITITTPNPGSFGGSTSLFGGSSPPSNNQAQELAVSDTYKILELPEKLDIKQGRTLAMELFRAQDIPVSRIYTFTHAWTWQGSSAFSYGNGRGAESDDRDIQCAWQIMNTTESKLGRMLPAGVVWVYLKDASTATNASGQLQIITGITPVAAVNPGDPFRVPTGAAPLTRAVRDVKITSVQGANDKQWKATVYLKLINAGAKDISVEVVESFEPRLSWKLSKSDFPSKQRGFNQSVITSPVPKHGLAETTLEFDLWR